MFGQSSDIDIYRCVRCGLGVTSGIAATTSAYHRDWVYKEREAQFRNIFQKRVGIIEKFAERGRALEVGSSTGVLLSLLKERGWNVAGVEPSKEAASVAKKRGIPTIVLPFERVRVTGEKYDVVIFNHTLEHMINPLTILKKAGSILKTGGTLFIDVPNFASLAARVAGASWKYILPNEHRWHFTPSALFNLLNKSGFSPVWWEAHSGVWGYANPAREVWESLSGGKMRFFTNMLTLLPAWIITKLGVGTGLTIIAKKVK